MVQAVQLLAFVRKLNVPLGQGAQSKTPAVLRRYSPATQSLSAQAGSSDPKPQGAQPRSDVAVPARNS